MNPTYYILITYTPDYGHSVETYHRESLHESTIKAIEEDWSVGEPLEYQEDYTDSEGEILRVYEGVDRVYVPLDRKKNLGDPQKQNMTLDGSFRFFFFYRHV